MTQQLKVFEFAKQIGVETLTLMDKIREWQLPIKSHMATLDEAMMEEIQTRLTAARHAAESSAKTKKKTVKKKVEAKAEAAPASAKKASVAAPTPIKKAAAAAAKTTALKPPAKAAAPSKAPVIRRKAGEAEQKALEAAEENMRALAAVEAEGQQPVEAQANAGTDAQEGAVAVVNAPEAAPIGDPNVRARKNIVGRMDLRRVATIQQPNSTGPGAGGPGAPRVSRSAPRNIRTGFFTAEPAFVPPPEDEFKSRAKDDKTPKKRPGTGGREEVVKVFAATEFRKREVIFQPKKKKAITSRDVRKTQITTPAAHKRIVKVFGTIKVSELAMQMGIKAPALIKKLITDGVTATINSDLDYDTVALIAPEFGWEAQNVKRSSDDLMKEAAFGNLGAEIIVRPPVVTIMGHVDHGKTTLLDSIRKAKVAAGEAGGITQHIGAYSVTVDGHTITFIDTPGHEAFTAMRARGANVTDIAIIVVAAEDGLMPQTAEAINHAKAAGVPIIVAVNKMDKPGATMDRIKQQLTEFELVPEEWGGTTIFCPVSALKGDGVKELLEQINVVAEVQELKANPKRSATGTVIESRMEKGRGSVATLLVRDGTLKVGDTMAAGAVVGRVRSMLNDQGKPVKEVLPGYPVEILGLPMPPQAGDRFDVTKDEETAQALAASRSVIAKVEEMPNSKMTLDQLFAKVKSGDVKELALVLKTDVAGSLEAVKGMIEKLSTEEVKVRIIHTGVGGINESDVLLASTANGLIVGFNVRPDTSAARLAKERNLEIKSYTIIYELVDELKKAMSGLLAPQVVETVQGRAEVRNTFVVPKAGTIAGCAVIDGKIGRNNQARLIRDGKIIFDTKISSLKRFKDDAREVVQGFECGIGLENFNDIKVGDNIEAYIKVEVAREM